MKRQVLAVACAAVMSLTGPIIDPSAGPRAADTPSCDPVGRLSFVCGVANVEDLISVPGSPWLIGSSMRQGPAARRPGPALYLINVNAKTAQAAAIALDPARRGPFAGCPAPDPARLGTHGLELRAGPGRVHTLYAINHGGRESLEVFRVDTRGEAPVVTWTGCLIMPPNTWANSVAALPHGALAISKFADLDTLSMGPVFRGEVTGVTYVWTPGGGFAEVAGGRLSGNNGLLASKDGRRLWINDTGRQQIVRLTLDGSAPPAYAKLGFNPDNLRWAQNGTMLVAGQIVPPGGSLGAPNGWSVARLDPETMAVNPLMTEPGRAEFSNGTVALQVGQTLWLGNFRGDRIAYTPLK